MATDIATLGIKIEAKDIKKAVSELDRLEKQGKKTEKATDGITKSFGGLKSAIAGLGLGYVTKQLIDQINKYSALSNQLKLVTKDAADLATVQAQLFEVAQDSRGSLEGTIDLYSRLARSTGELELSSRDLIGVTKTINQAIALSSTTASTAAASLFQLGQGLGAGALRGEELNSILEGTPELANAIAAGLGTTIAGLKKMGAAGELNAEKVIGALQKQAGAVDAAFNQTSKTVSQAFTQIENVALQTFGSLDDKELVGALDEFRTILQDPAVTDGLQNLASGLVQIVSLTAKAAAGVGDLFVEVSTTAQWLAAYQSGHISFFEWVSTGNEAAKARLEELRAELNKVTGALNEANGAAGGTSSGIPKLSSDDEVAIEAAKNQNLLELGQMYLADFQEQEQAKADLELEMKLRTQAAILMANEEYNQMVFDQEAEAFLDKMDQQEARDAYELSKAEQLAKDKETILRGSLQNMSALMSSGNKTLFNIGKAAALADGLLGLRKSIMDAYTFGNKIGGPWVGAAYAATAGIAQAANLSAISSASFGGGGGAGSAGVASSASNGQPSDTPIAPSTGSTETAAPRQVSITLNGSNYSRESVRELIDSINEELGDGSVLVA